MTDRYNALTVVLDHDIRKDDADAILTAIRMVRGVLRVDPIVADPGAWVVEQRVRREIEERVWKALRESK